MTSEFETIKTSIQRAEQQAESLFKARAEIKQKIRELEKKLISVCPHQNTKILTDTIVEPKILPRREQRKTCEDCGKLIGVRGETSDWGEWR